MTEIIVTITYFVLKFIRYASFGDFCGLSQHQSKDRYFDLDLGQLKCTGQLDDEIFQEESPLEIP